MATEVLFEKQKSNSRGKSSIHVRNYKIKGAANIAAAIAAVRGSSECPSSVSVVNPDSGFYVLTGPEGVPEVECTEWMANRGIYTATATWTHPESRRNDKQGVNLTDVGDTHYEYTFSGQQVNELFSEATTIYDGSGSASYDKAINFTPEKGVQGAPISRMIGGIKISKLFGPSEVDGAWVNTRKSIVHKKVNSDTFEYAAAEEALLTDFRVVSKESGNWLAEFTIATGDNESGVTVSGIAGVTFKAWDLVEVVSDIEVDNTKKIEKAVAKYVLVHERYTSTAYSDLLTPA